MRIITICWFFLLFCLSSNAQQIILDLPVRAGALTLFPEVGDRNNYYYLADKAELAIREDGRPQFSFLRYVENQRSGADEENIREGQGGGIVHAVVSLHVSDDQIKEANRELRRINSEGVIVGPIIYKSGKFGLVSSFVEENGELTKKVVGLGAAPILDGQKAAISIHLTKLGAKILWESFKTSTPDISFTFEMDIEGFRLPKKARIEANFEQIYKHKAFNAGISTPYLAAEIKLAFDELVKSGAIKVEQVGSDESMNNLISTAYNKLTEMMFAPIGGSGNPNLSQLMQGAGNNQSVLDRATNMMNNNNNNNRSRRNGRTGMIKDTYAEENWLCALDPDRVYFSPSKYAATVYHTDFDKNQQLRLDTVPEIRTPGSSSDSTNTDGIQEEQGENETTGASEGNPTTDEAETQENGEEDSTTSDEGNAAQDTSRNRAQRDNRSNNINFAVVATFEMKQVKQSGKFVIDLNKWTQDIITSRFDENIGNLSKYMDDPLHFHQINTDDPLYQQREIVVMVDGSNASDFGTFINYVSVRMKKTHDKGAVTHDEIRIDRFNFNEHGNYFKMLYGWNGDDPNSRAQWMQYEYEVKWSFFGDYELVEPLKSTNFGAINLKPPLKKLNIELQGDLSVLTAAKVRSVTVQIFYNIGDKAYKTTETIAVGPNMAFKNIEIITPLMEYDFDYQLSWRIRGGEMIHSKRLNTNQSILFIDELL